MHTRTRERTDLAVAFNDLTYLRTLRINPYHVRVAERRPDLAPAVEEVIRGMLTNRQCLVHGDFSPKNLLTDGPRVVLLDCEVAHWGDPRFDLAFCLCHLLLKIIHAESCADRLVEAANAYLESYAREGLDVMDFELSRATGCLVLARVIGDSPVDYLHTDELRAAASHLGERLLLEPAPVNALARRAMEARP
jgi:aminoglycoside phosphotransferase (APT) family kinase protein